MAWATYSVEAVISGDVKITLLRGLLAVTISNTSPVVKSVNAISVKTPVSDPVRANEPCAGAPATTIGHCLAGAAMGALFDIDGGAPVAASVVGFNFV